jgi:RHS repeat-associated protein
VQLALLAAGVALSLPRTATAQECDDVPLCIWTTPDEGGTWTPSSNFPDSSLQADPSPVNDQSPAPIYSTSGALPSGARRAEAIVSGIKVTSSPPVPPGANVPPGAQQQGTSLAQPPTPVPGRTYQQAFDAATPPRPLGPTLPAGSPAIPAVQGPTPPPSHQPNVALASKQGSDPVDSATGEFVYQVVDLAFPGFGVPFELKRTYRSRLDYSGPLGFGWDHSLNQKVVRADANTIVFSNGEGQTIVFSLSSGVWSATDPRIFLQIQPNADGTTLLWDPRGLIRSFDAGGFLQSERDVHGVGLSVTWEATPTGDKRVASVDDSVGRHIQFSYRADGFLGAVSASGLDASYDYTNGDLILAQNAQGRTEGYEYQNGFADAGSIALTEDQIQNGCREACLGPNAACSTDYQNLNTCQSGCEQCQTGCVSSCSTYCVNQGCPNQCQSACRDVCSDSATTQAACDFIWNHGAKKDCSGCNGDNGCSFYCGDASLCFSAYLASAANPITYAECLGGGFPSGLSGQQIEQLLKNMGANWLMSAWSIVVLAGAGVEDAGICAGTAVGAIACDFADLFGADCHVDVDCDFNHAKDAFAKFCGDRCTTCNDNGDGCGSIALTGGGSITSCNSGIDCNTDCQNTFYGTGQHCGATSCPATVVNQCAANCRPGCVASCTGDCSSRCDSGCSGVCGTTCHQSCVSTVNVTSCERGCVDGCVASTHQAQGGAIVFGSPTALNHDLRRIRNSAGGLIVENTYGADPGSPDFDRVISQTNGGRIISYHSVLLATDQTPAIVDQDPLTAFVTSYVPSNPCDRQFLTASVPPAFAAAFPSNPGIITPPARAVVVRDAFGVVWVHHFDQNFNLLRTLNQGTGAEYRYTYDERGLQDGEVLPTGVFTCRLHDTRGDLVLAVTAADPPTFSGFAYQLDVPFVKPTRLTDVLDSRDFSRALVHHVWDAAGDLSSTTDAAGTTQYHFDVSGRLFGLDAANGGHTSILYDATNGTVSNVTVGVGGAAPIASSLRSDPGGRPLNGTGPGGETTTWVWVGKTLSSIARHAPEVPDEVQTFVWDGDARLKQWDDGDLQATFTYDALGFPTSVARSDLTTGEQRTTCSHYRPDGQVEETVSAEGRRVRVSYDGEGRPSGAIGGRLAPSPDTWDDPCQASGSGPPSPGRQLWKIGRDPNGSVSLLTDGRGSSTTVTNDGLGRPAVVTFPAGNIRHIGYDEIGDVSWVADYKCGYGNSCATPTYIHPVVSQAIGGTPDLGSLIDFGYDQLGRLASRSAAMFQASDLPLTNNVPIGDGSSLTKWTYAPEIGRTTVTDDNGNVFATQIDESGRPALFLADGAGKVRTSYGPSGTTISRVWTAPSATGFAGEQLTLTSWGAIAQRSVAQVGADGTIAATFPLETASYDRHRRYAHTTQADGFAAGVVYNAFGEPTDTTSAFGSAEELVHSEWTPDGLLHSRLSRAGADTPDALTQYDYDDLGRPFSLTRPGQPSQLTTYYGASTQVSTRSDERGVTFTYGRFTDGLISSISAVRPSGGTELRLYSYDGIGRLKTALNPAAGIRNDYVRDSLGAVLNEAINVGTFAPAVSLSYQRDGLGQAVQTTIDGPLVPGSVILGPGTVQKQFDALGRVVSATAAFRGATASVATTYSGFGGPTTRSYQPSAPPADAPGTTYSYDDLARLTRAIDKFNGAFGEVQEGFQWYQPLDGVPRIVQRIDADLFGTQTVTPVSAYSTEGAGRLVGEGHDNLAAVPDDLSPFSDSATANHAAATVGIRTTYTLDGRGNWVSRSGPPAAFTTTRTAVDQYATVSGSAASYDGNLLTVAPNGAASDQYSYNLFGELTQATAAGASPVGLAYDALGRLTERTQGPTQTPPIFAYDGASRILSSTSGLTVDGDLDEHLFTITPDGAAFFYTQGPDRSVMSVQDQGGTTVRRYAYTAYGVRSRTDPVTSEAPDEFGFQGLFQDSSTGLAYARNRWIRPSWGRFLAGDPIGFAGGSNLFAFVGSAPLAFTDPFGLTPVQSNVAQRLTSTFYQQQSDYYQAQAFGSDVSVGQRVSGFLGYVYYSFPAAAETITNTPGAFVGNVIDQARLRGAADQAFTQGNSALGQQLVNQADRQSDVAGARLQAGLLGTTALVGGGGLLSSQAGATVVTIDATGVAPVVRSGSLPIVGPHFTPDAGAVLQNMTNFQNAALGENPGIAQQVLTVREYTAATANAGGAALQYGNALERLVGNQIDSSPLTLQILERAGGPNREDFVGVGPAAGRLFDITTDTVRQINSHLNRPYGAFLELILYTRPSPLTFPPPTRQ